MIIAIDVGNTNIVLGCIDEQTIYFTARLSTDRFKTADEYAVTIRNILELYKADLSLVEGGIISSVVPSLSTVLQEAVEKITGHRSLIVGSGLKTGLNILIDNPAQLGSDLVVDAVAAISQYPKPIMIFDMGTATTLSVVDQHGNYLGGMIIPGVTLALDALSSRTSQLPRIRLDKPKRVVGTNTVDCMQSGIIYGNAAMLDGIIDRVERELGATTTVVATGGFSRSIVPYCQRKIICDGDLMLKGLLLLYNKNKKSER